MVKKNAFEVGISVGFPRAVMPVVRPKRGQALRPLHQVHFDSRFFIVHENTGRDMHGRNQRHPFPYAAFLHSIGNQACNVDKLPLVFRVKPVIYGVRFQAFNPLSFLFVISGMFLTGNLPGYGVPLNLSPASNYTLVIALKYDTSMVRLASL